MMQNADNWSLAWTTGRANLTDRYNGNTVQSEINNAKQRRKKSKSQS